ncbi:hypothetical protein MRB53_033032 [Persea americana]|uniref:Uncharacterized protein n=1 Tax=Persea americana TaxID=3435 RepID=A0ACC2KTT1_PERAE|nr:hypothetical protein MRB53_033032 [Persea americana]
MYRGRINIETLVVYSILLHELSEFGVADTVMSASPSAKFRLIAEERDEISRSVVSTSEQGLPKRFSVLLFRKIDWVSLKKICKEWIRNPINMVLFAWIICVAVSGAILFLVMTASKTLLPSGAFMPLENRRCSKTQKDILQKWHIQAS